MRVRSALIRVIYDKALVLSCSERSSRSTGEIANLMSVDAMRVQSLFIDGLLLLSCPLQVALAFFSLHRLLGWPAFVGVGVMAASIPLNMRIAGVMKSMQRAQMANRDARTKAMAEVLANMKTCAPSFIPQCQSNG